MTNLSPEGGYLLGIDAGTTAMKVVLFDQAGRSLGQASQDRLRYEARRPAAGGGRENGADGIQEADRLPSPRPGPERQAAGKQMAAALGRALARLTDRQRAAILLRHQQGLSYPEVADALGVPQGTAKTLVHRGVLTLRGILEARQEVRENGAEAERTDE